MGTQAVTDATATQATACNAPVTMVVNLPTLTASTCYDYTQEAHFLSVQGACDAANTALSQANSALGVAQTAATDAQTSLDAAVAEAARLMSECHCRVQQEQAAAWTAAGTATASHAADWKQAHEVLCALDQTSTCTVPTCPAVTQPTLAAGVADEVCSTVDGSVRAENGATATAGVAFVPEVMSNGNWYPICGHYFWDNNDGATTVCQGLGYGGFSSGTRQHVRDTYSADSMPVGECSAGQALTSCNHGGNGWGNLEYNGGWCKTGTQIGVTVTCNLFG